jgi:glycosyltransferase involved in cell wall biosynthesis
MNGISLVMATIGRFEEVRRFIQCLHVQANRGLELIVVDQNRDDRLVPVLAKVPEMGIALRHIRQAEPNLCLARNTGLANASMDVVGFPDDDCWYEPETLDLVMERLSMRDAPSGVVIRWAEQDLREQPAYTLDFAKWRAFREVNASSITLFYRTDLFRSIGGFDPALGLHSWFGGAEETDLMFRVLARGATVVYLPDALVHHTYGIPPHQSVAAAFRYSRRRGRGTGGIYAKHKLSALVIGRGLSAPVVRSLLNINQPRVAASYLGTSLGRLEGYLRWRMRESA